MIFDESRATEEDWKELEDWIKQHMENKEKRRRGMRDFNGNELDSDKTSYPLGQNLGVVKPEFVDGHKSRQVLVDSINIVLTYADNPSVQVAVMDYNSRDKTWKISGIPLYPRFVNLLTTLNDFIHSNNRNSREKH